MPGDELFKRYLEIGASVVGMTRERAESIVKDLVASGEVAKSQATKAADWLVERGRTGTEEVAELVRREIRQQVTALGLATKDDIARLEARLEEYRAANAAGSEPVAEPATRPRKAKAKATAPTAPDGEATATPPPGTTSAGISRAGSVRKRAGVPRSAGAGNVRAAGTGGSDFSEPGAAPPAGGADPSKG